MKKETPTAEQLDNLARRYAGCRNFDEFCALAPLVDARCCNHQREKILEVKALRRAYRQRTGKNLPHNKGTFQKGSPQRQKVSRQPKTTTFSGYVPLTAHEASFETATRRGL